MVGLKAGRDDLVLGIPLGSQAQEAPAGNPGPVLVQGQLVDIDPQVGVRVGSDNAPQLLTRNVGVVVRTLTRINPDLARQRMERILKR